MRIKITSDSTCDLSPALLEKHGVAVMPLTVVKDGEQYLDGVTITPHDIFAHVASGGSLCSTAAVNSADYHDFWEAYAAEYDAVIHINIGSGFSSCHQNARIAAEDFENVYAVDSQNLSTGQGLVVMEACRLAADAADAASVVEALNAMTGKVEASFLLDQLAYMVKGGRCSSAAALGANLLNLKPCIEVKDGKMSVVKKYRGPYAKCLANYVQDRLAGREDVREELLFLTYTPVKPDCLAAVKEAIAEHGSYFAAVEETTAGCTVSCHCGPGTLGVLFVRK